MKSFNYVIKDIVGMHARPAGLLVKEAKKYKSKICIARRNGNSDDAAEATKIMALLALGLKCGEAIIVSVEGEDEESAVVNIQKFFEENL